MPQPKYVKCYEEENYSVKWGCITALEANLFFQRTDNCFFL